MTNKYNRIESLIHNKRKHIDDVRVKRFWNFGRQKTRKQRELPNVANGNIINGNILFVRWIACSIRLSDKDKFILIYEPVIGIMPLPLIRTNIWSELDFCLSLSAFISLIYPIINMESNNAP